MIPQSTTKALAHQQRQIENCEVKIAFDTMGHALRYVAKLPFHNRAYRCGICGLWHLTKQGAR